ncbi:MAG: hypothetical protein K2X87_15695, partial [Gemmataceae bacterium]|nr:hypothetical protein [Gemmataceae bacterium]
AADRVFARGPLVTLGAGLAAVAVIEAAGIGYRVVEVPDPPGGEADVAFVATLPEFDVNLGGRDFRTAAERYSRVAAAATATAERANPRAPRVEDRLETVLQGGWPTDRPVDPQLEPALVGVGGGAGAAARADRLDPELDRWMNDVYADKAASPDDRAWYDWAELAALRPYAAFEDPRQFAGLTATALLPMENARRMALAVLVRGLQRQAAGDHAAFVGAFRVASALARSLRTRSIIPAAQVGYGVERLALVAAHVWARNLPAAGTADRLAAAYLLSQVLAADPEPDPHAPFDPTPYLLAQRYVLRGLMSAPNQWLPDAITPPGKSKDAAGPEADLVSFAWTVPWERERTRRLVGAAYEAADRHGPYPLVRGRPGAQLLVAWGTAPTDLADLDRAVRAYRRGLAVCLAVRLFETGGGRPPASVEELVAAKCLPQVPPDPFDGQPVRYRVSAGEVLTSSVRPGPGGRGTDVPLTYTVSAGRPVIWVVGPDRIDQGGRQVPILPAGFPRQEDWVFLVP